MSLESKSYGWRHFENSDNESKSYGWRHFENSDDDDDRGIAVFGSRNYRSSKLVEIELRHLWVKMNLSLVSLKQ